MNTYELTLLKAFFHTSTSSFFNVYLTITTITNLTVVTNSTVSMIFELDSPPANGNCWTNTTSGFSMVTYFNIECTNWTSSGGFIAEYEYYGNFFFVFYL
jgi:hypothetical protein